MNTLIASAAPTIDLPAATTNASDFYNVSQAAALLGVSRVTLSRWIRAGALPVAHLGHRTVRIAREDLDQLIVERGRGHARVWVGRERVARAGARRLHGAPTAEGAMTPTAHVVQFYKADAFLLDAVAAFLAEGFRSGEPGLVVATPAHRVGLEARLAATGLDVPVARAVGQYLDLDAADTLAQFMIAGMPDPTRFEEVIGEVITRAGGGRPLHIAGEMVALLTADGNHRAALRLEELWNALQLRRAFSLFCAYPLDVFRGAAGAAHLGQVCVAHSRVLPAESAPALPAAADHSTDTGQALRALLAAVVESSDDAILTKTLDGVITSWNRAAERLYGYTAAEAIGQPVTLHMPPEQENDFPVIMSRLRRGQTVDHYETVRQHKDGHRIEVSVTVSPLVAADGSIIGASAIARDISERKQLEAEREAFAATLTHDLKSPLTAVLGMAQLLRRRLERGVSLHGDELSEGLQRIGTSSSRTVRMLDELLDLARLRSGQPLELQRGPCDLVTVAHRVVEEQQQLTTRHRLTVRTTESALVGSWDERRLDRVLSNLVGNAVKYSPEGGEVTVTLQRNEAAASAFVIVADQGVGIPAADLPTLFTAFRRGSNVAGRIGGAGIGLLSVKQIVQQHGGSLAVESEEGHGTTVRVSLPLA